MATVQSQPEIVRLENVGLRYALGPEILQDVSLTLRTGSFHFLTGPSGSGKSSLMSLLYLARRPTRGMVRLFGQDVSSLSRDELPALRRRIGVVFQDFRLLEHFNALDNVALPLYVAGGGKEKMIREHVVDLLRWVGLGDRLDAAPSTLSGGEKQRVAIARAVIARPQLLLADEPTGNVDEDIALRLMYLLEELNRLGTTVLIATHNRELVARFDHPEIVLPGHGGAE